MSESFNIAGTVGGGDGMVNPWTRKYMLRPVARCCRGA